MRKLRRIPLLLMALVASPVLLGGCDSPTDPQTRVAGTYTMTQVNGQAPPVTVLQVPEGRIEVTGGSMVLRADGSYTETVQVRVTPTGGSPQSDQQVENGTYAVTATSITFTVPPSAGQAAFSYSGTISGDIITYTEQGVSVTYRKQ